MSDNIRGIVAFDLDGTLLHGETVCEVLARPLGRLKEMKRFESFTEERDVAAARREMAQWFWGHTLEELQLHLRNAHWASGAHEAVRRLQGTNVEVAILSVTWSFAVRWFAEQLQVQHSLGTELLPTGEIIHTWGRDKARFLRALVRMRKVPPVRVGPQWVTQRVTSKCCMREGCDFLLARRRLLIWMRSYICRVWTFAQWRNVSSKRGRNRRLPRFRRSNLSNARTRHAHMQKAHVCATRSFQTTLS